MTMCRACLLTKPSLLPMDGTFLDNFNLVTGLNLSLMEKSLYSCKPCADAVKFCIKFRQKCIESNLSFQEICITDIKQEDCKSTHQDEAHTMSIIKEEFKFEIFEAEDESQDYGVMIIEENGIRVESNENDILHYSVASTDNQVALKRKSAQCKKKKIDTYKNKKRKISGLVPKNKLGTNKKPKLLEPASKKKTIDSENEMVQGTKNINKHGEKESSFKQLSCGLCSNSLIDKEALIKHLEEHKAASACGLCPETFVNLPHMLGHRMEHVPNEQKGCHICSKKKIKTAISLEYHLMTAHEMAQKGEKIKCKQCDRFYADAKKLRKHIKDSHSALKFKCDYCSKGFRFKSDMTQHIYMHNASKSYKCKFCDFTSKSNTTMTTHNLRRHNKNRVDCKMCSTIFRTEKGKKLHVCRAGLIVVCNICGKSLKKFSLQRHMRSHDEIGRYKCDKCPANFKSRSNYNSHMDKHAGTPKYQCEYCQRSFYSSPVLRKHRRTHTGEKPYVCSICSRGFTGNHNLKVHMKVHGITNLIAKKECIE